MRRRSSLLAVTCLMGLALTLVACGPSGGAPGAASLPQGGSEPTVTPLPVTPETPGVPTPSLPGTPAPTPSATTAQFEPAECAFEAPFWRTVDCGYVSMPAHRDGSGDGEVRLHVAIVRAESEDPQPDPVVYLAGGPGENALALMGFLIGLLHPFSVDRDLIVFDQRGTGFSQPALACQELTDLAYETLDADLADEDALALELEALGACRDRLVGEGVDLSAFSTGENAADVRDLRTALGYDEWNLLGVSYGSRLALTVMRDHPEGIRSVILDSTYPLDANLYESLPLGADRAFTVLAESCEADEECAAAYPDLRGQMDAAYERLEADPVPSTVRHPLSGEAFDAIIDGDTFLTQIFQGLYSREVLPLLPEMIAGAADGDVALVSLLAGISLVNLEFVSSGMQMSLQCREDLAATTRERLQEAVMAAPGARHFFEDGVTYAEGLLASCRVWDVPAEPNPGPGTVDSDIPTLVLAGEFDPVTPPEWGRDVADMLSQGRFIEFPGYGHGAVTGECGVDIAVQFVDGPIADLETSCVDALGPPAFVLPLEQTSMMPFQDPESGITGVRPERWQEVAPSVFFRSPLGETALVHVALPGVPMQTYLSLLLTEFEIEEPLEPVDTLTVNGMEWAIYEAQVDDAAAFVALAEQGGATLSVVAAGMTSTADALREHVFLPAVAGFIYAP